MCVPEEEPVQISVPVVDEVTAQAHAPVELPPCRWWPETKTRVPRSQAFCFDVQTAAARQNIREYLDFLDSSEGPLLFDMTDIQQSFDIATGSTSDCEKAESAAIVDPDNPAHQHGKIEPQ